MKSSLTPACLAVRNASNVTPASMLEIIDTMRFVLSPLDFSDELDGGSSIYQPLLDSLDWPGGAKDTLTALLLWVLKYASLELIIEVDHSHYAWILKYVFKPSNGSADTSEIIDVVIKMCGDQVLNARLQRGDGYAILQSMMLKPEQDVRLVLSKNHDLHRSCLHPLSSPQLKTAASLPMYSAWAFDLWLDGLCASGTGVDDFIEEELNKNFAVHPGWKKETFAQLFIGDWDRVSPRRPCELGTEVPCSDCAVRHSLVSSPIRIESHWRHEIEKIKEGFHPCFPVQGGGEGPEDNISDIYSLAATVQSSNILIDWPQLTQSAVDSEYGTQLDTGTDVDIHQYPSTVSLHEDCIYEKDEMICMRCWSHCLRTGTQYPVENLGGVKNVVFDCSTGIQYPYYPERIGMLTYGAVPEEEPSDDDFSPFHVHS